MHLLVGHLGEILLKKSNTVNESTVRGTTSILASFRRGDLEFVESRSGTRELSLENLVQTGALELLGESTHLVHDTSVLLDSRKNLGVLVLVVLDNVVHGVSPSSLTVHLPGHAVQGLFDLLDTAVNVEVESSGRLVRKVRGVSVIVIERSERRKGVSLAHILEKIRRRSQVKRVGNSVCRKSGSGIRKSLIENESRK